MMENLSNLHKGQLKSSTEFYRDFRMYVVGYIRGIDNK